MGFHAGIAQVLAPRLYADAMTHEGANATVLAGSAAVAKPAFRPKLLRLRGSLSVAGIVRALFGFDFFISYAHDDGIEYPQALSRALEAEPYRYKTHFDTRDYHIGDDLGLLTRWRVRNSARLVVVAGPHALTKSTWVRREVDAFTASGRTPLIIQLFGAPQPSLAGVDSGLLLDWLAANPEVLRHPETGPPSAPSQATILHLTSAFEGLRVEVWRRRVVAATLVALCVLLGLAVLGGLIAEWRREEAEEERQRVQIELSRADARQAEQMLASGQDDAAAVYVARARSTRAADLSDLVGHMLPTPLLAPTKRVRIPLSGGAVTRAWADDEGHFFAVQQAVSDEAVSVFDWRGAKPRLAAKLQVTPGDPVFRVVSRPRPAAIMMAGNPARGPDAGRGLTIRWLDGDKSEPEALAVKADGGYANIIRLADGRYYFSEGPTLTAVSIEAEGPKIEEIPSSLKGYANHFIAADGAPCLIQSDTTGEVRLHYVDGRAGLAWSGGAFFQTLDHQNPQHPQGVLDKTCRYAAIWFDGGGPKVSLIRLFDAVGALHPSLIATVEGDRNDSISFRNRFFAADGSYFVLRNAGRWYIYDTADGRLRRTIDSGLLESPGALSEEGTLLTAGYGDVVAYSPAQSAGREGKVTAGTAPSIFPIQTAAAKDTKKLDRAASFLTVSGDGIVTRYEPVPFQRRYELFVDAAGVGVYSALSAEGDILVQSVVKDGKPHVLLQKVDYTSQFRPFNCDGLTAITLASVADALELIGAGSDGTLCRATIDRRDLTLSPVVKTKVGDIGTINRILALAPSRLLLADESAGRVYDLLWPATDPPLSVPVSAASAGPIADLAADGAGNAAILTRDSGVVLLTPAGRAVVTLPGPCTRLIGVSARGAMALCEKDYASRAILVPPGGSLRLLATPAGAQLHGATLTPDGSALIAPLADSDGWVRRLYAQLIDGGNSFVFTPALLAELAGGDLNDFDKANKLPRIERVVISAGGERMFLGIMEHPLSNYYVSNGPLGRFDVSEVSKATKLSLGGASQGSLNLLIDELSIGESLPFPRSRGERNTPIQ